VICGRKSPHGAPQVVVHRSHSPCVRPGPYSPEDREFCILRLAGTRDRARKLLSVGEFTNVLVR